MADSHVHLWAAKMLRWVSLSHTRACVLLYRFIYRK